MDSAVDKKEYLKKYLSGGDKKKRKKKTVSSSSVLAKSRIIDDDLDLKKLRPLGVNELDMYDMNEDAPQVVGIVDDRPDDIQLIAQFRETKKWKVIARDYEDVKVSAVNNNSDEDNAGKSVQIRREINSDSDASVPRRKEDRDSDASPPRRSRKEPGKKKSSQVMKKNQDVDSDASPPRKKKSGGDDSDASPPRRKKTANYDSDKSPPRRRKAAREDSDASPARKRKTVHSSSARSKNKDPDSDASPHRRNNDSDVSPPRKKKQDDSDSDLSPRRKSDHRRSDRRPGREDSRRRDSQRNKRDGNSNKTLEGKKAGLQNIDEMRKEAAELRKKQHESLSKLGDEVSGRGAATIVRDRKTGRKKDYREEAKQKREKEEREAELQEKYAVWGKGLKQVDDKAAKMREEMHEMSKPLARYANDEDLEELQKNQEREGDPMLDYFREKKRKEGRGGPVKQLFQGNFMPNRYGIRPGAKWDGVDRSNGYEKKWFEEQNKRRAIQDDSYKWSTEDM